MTRSINLQINNCADCPFHEDIGKDTIMCGDDWDIKTSRDEVPKTCPLQKRIRKMKDEYYDNIMCWRDAKINHGDRFKELFQTNTEMPNEVHSRK